jgi:succinoglycan biosynthesis protein ExoM
MISVCIATYKRPQQLAVLLQILVNSVLRPERLEIIICDNDENRTAERVVKTASTLADIQIKYFCEPEQNISVARNRTVKEATGEWIAFIDDDEIPTPTWLMHLHKTAFQNDADGVFGPVYRLLPDTSPDWISAGNFFSSYKLTTGAEIGVANARTGNALVKAAVLSEINGPFDCRYGRSGGEDTFLFGMLLVKRRARFLGCQEATVWENVDAYRCTRSWLVRRAFRGGLIWSRIEAELKGSMKSIFWRAMLALISMPFLILLALLSFAFGPAKNTTVLNLVAAKFGQLCALLPIQYVEYK